MKIVVRESGERDDHKIRFVGNARRYDRETIVCQLLACNTLVDDDRCQFDLEVFMSSAPIISKRMAEEMLVQKAAQDDAFSRQPVSKTGVGVTPPWAQIPPSPPPFYPK